MPPEIRESEVAAQWDRNADVWADHVRNRWDIFREYWNNPAFLEFAGGPGWRNRSGPLLPPSPPLGPLL